MAFLVDGDISNLHKRCSLAQFPWENCAHDHDETCLPMMPLKNIQLQPNETQLEPNRKQLVCTQLAPTTHPIQRLVPPHPRSVPWAVGSTRGTPFQKPVFEIVSPATLSPTMGGRSHWGDNGGKGVSLMHRQHWRDKGSRGGG